MCDSETICYRSIVKVFTFIAVVNTIRSNNDTYYRYSNIYTYKRSSTMNNAVPMRWYTTNKSLNNATAEDIMTYAMAVGVKKLLVSALLYSI